MIDLEEFKNAIYPTIFADRKLADVMVRYFFNTDEPDYRDWLFAVAQEYCLHIDTEPKKLTLSAIDNIELNNICQQEYTQYYNLYKLYVSNKRTREKAYNKYRRS